MSAETRSPEFFVAQGQRGVAPSPQRSAATGVRKRRERKGAIDSGQHSSPDSHVDTPSIVSIVFPGSGRLLNWPSTPCCAGDTSWTTVTKNCGTRLSVVAFQAIPQVGARTFTCGCNRAAEDLKRSLTTSHDGDRVDPSSNYP